MTLLDLVVNGLVEAGVIGEGEVLELIDEEMGEGFQATLSLIECHIPAFSNSVHFSLTVEDGSEDDAQSEAP